VAEQALREVPRTDLADHPAVRAWEKLRPGQARPESVATLGDKKSVIYRLAGVDRGGSAVIAKHCQKATALIERAVYEEILPHLPLTTLHYYGFVEDGPSSWLFLEDAGREKFSPLSEGHRALAAQWLGHMHTSAARVAAAARLPDRGPGHYLEQLRSARQIILRNPALPGAGRAVLRAVVSQGDALELRWDEVEKSCAGLPATLVHGDFRRKNLCVRTGQAGTALFAVDWEMAGWGVPAADLAPSRGVVAQVNLPVYWSIVREHWPGLDVRALERLANVGTIFRRLAAVHWACWAAARWPAKVIDSMRVSQAEMAHAVRAAGWAK
jgi:hypothetical protein